MEWAILSTTVYSMAWVVCYMYYSYVCFPNMFECNVHALIVAVSVAQSILVATDMCRA